MRSAESSFTSTGAAQWNEIIYTKIAVLGDSFSAQRQISDESWPIRMQDRLNSAGAIVQTKNFSTGSHSFFRANTTATYGTNTAVAALIAWNPDVVIIELGANDSSYTAQGTGDNRTEVQIQADAALTYSTIAAALPNACLIQVNLRMFDEDNFTTSTVKNKGVIPQFMTAKAAGILTGLNASEMLDDSPSATIKSLLDIYDNLMTSIDGISGVNMLSVNAFRISRMGCDLSDRKHWTPFGHTVFSSYMIKGLRNITDFTDIVPVIATQPTGTFFESEDPDELFADVLDTSGDGYTEATPDRTGGEAVDSSWGGSARVVRTENWYLAYKASFYFGDTTPRNSVLPDGMVPIFVSGAQPNTALNFSINGAAFAAFGNTTDMHGTIITQLPIALLNLPNGSATSFRFQIGNDVFGPISVTPSATAFGFIVTTSVGNVGGGEDDLQTSTITAGQAFADVGRGIRVVQHGTFANNSNPKTIKVYFGTATIVTGTLATGLAGNWHTEWSAYATADGAQKYQGYFIRQTAAGTWPPVLFEGTATQDEDANLVIKCTATVTDGGGGINNDDVVQTFQRVYYE